MSLVAAAAAKTASCPLHVVPVQQLLSHSAVPLHSVSRPLWSRWLLLCSPPTPHVYATAIQPFRLPLHVAIYRLSFFFFSCDARARARLVICGREQGAGSCETCCAPWKAAGAGGAQRSSKQQRRRHDVCVRPVRQGPQQAAGKHAWVAASHAALEYVAHGKSLQGSSQQQPAAARAFGSFGSGLLCCRADHSFSIYTFKSVDLN